MECSPNPLSLESKEAQAIQLALWRRVIFVDWHGVLSKAPFWHSILWNKRHPYYHDFDTEIGRLFANSELVNLWMLGIKTTEEVLRDVHVKLDGRARENFLWRRLLQDCRRMPIAHLLMTTLGRLRAGAYVVIATDNADCFELAVEGRRELGFADELLSSSSLGVLKSEAPDRFFGPWLAKHGLTFANALLVDDNEDNCEAFRAHGGLTLHVNDPDQAALELEALVEKLP